MFLPQTGEDVKNDQFDAAYDLSSADDGEVKRFVVKCLVVGRCET